MSLSSNYFEVKESCAANGPGVRTAIFLSGCNLHCPGCFNQVAWDFNSGKLLNRRIVTQIVETLSPKYIQGLSILGGEPMDPKNQEAVLAFINEVRNQFGDKKDIWMWTGYVIDKNLPKTEFTNEILSKIDVIVDGPWKQELWDQTLRFRGSSNQRILYRGKDF